MKGLVALVLMLVSMACVTQVLNAADEPEQSIMAGTIVIQTDRTPAHDVLAQYQEMTMALVGATQLEMAMLDQYAEKLIETKGLGPDNDGKKAGLIRLQTQMLFNLAQAKLMEAEAAVITAEGEVELLEAVILLVKGQRILTQTRVSISECQAVLEAFDKKTPNKSNGVDA